MEYTQLGDVFNNYAFPTAVVIILMIFIFIVVKSYKKTVDDQKEDLKALNDKYHEDYAKVIDVLNNNTNALNSLRDMVNFFIRRYENNDDSK